MKKRILIDVDDVICENHFFELINEYLASVGEPVITDWDVFDRADIEHAFHNDAKIVDGFLDEYYPKFDSYKNTKPLPGAVEAIKILNEKHDVYLVTSCIDVSRARLFARQFTDKYFWILDHLSFLDPRRIIMVSKKHIFRADVIIDDRLGNLKGDYTTKILFGSFHNHGVQEKHLADAGAVRADGWTEVLSIIEELD
jgi:5'(3')-deoxyribonucleotidase